MLSRHIATLNVLPGRDTIRRNTELVRTRRTISPCSNDCSGCGRLPQRCVLHRHCRKRLGRHLPEQARKVSTGPRLRGKTPAFEADGGLRNNGPARGPRPDLEKPRECTQVGSPDRHDRNEKKSPLPATTHKRNAQDALQHHEQCGRRRCKPDDLSRARRLGLFGWRHRLSCFAVCDTQEIEPPHGAANLALPRLSHQEHTFGCLDRGDCWGDQRTRGGCRRNRRRWVIHVGRRPRRQRQRDDHYYQCSYERPRTHFSSSPIRCRQQMFCRIACLGTTPTSRAQLKRLTPRTLSARLCAQTGLTIYNNTTFFCVCQVILSYFFLIFPLFVRGTGDTRNIRAVAAMLRGSSSERARATYHPKCGWEPSESGHPSGSGLRPGMYLHASASTGAYRP